MKKTLNVAMIGGGFMGKAHSNAWLKVNTFFDAPYKVNLKVIVGNHTPLEEFAERWGYDEVSYDWREVMKLSLIHIFNLSRAYCPPEIRRRTVCIEGDIGEILSRVRRARICQQAGA